MDISSFFDCEEEKLLDILKTKERLRLWLGKLSKNHGSEDIKVRDVGAYLICLLRHHLELEKESIHKAIKAELRKDEKKEVGKRIAKWFPEKEKAA